MTLGEVIRKYRESHDISMDRFADAAGISKAYVSFLERNRTPRGDAPVPSIDVYKKTASAMHITTDALVRMVDDDVGLLPDGLQPVPALHGWPVVGAAACGDPIHRETYDQEIFAPDDIKADAVYRCDGDSMNGARILDGDYVFIKFDADVENGKIYLVRLGDEYTLKRIYQTIGELRLVPENPAYATRVIAGEDLDGVEIVGKAVSVLGMVR